MPTWGEILEELQSQPAVQQGGPPDFDTVRRKYLTKLFQLTERPTIIYYSDFLSGGPAPGIDLSDMQAMMECCRGLGTDGVDLVLHSPGGSAEATAALSVTCGASSARSAYLCRWRRCRRPQCGLLRQIGSSWGSTRNSGRSIPS